MQAEHVSAQIEKPRAQAEISKYIRSLHFPPDWPALFHKRLAKMFHGQDSVAAFLRSNGPSK